jgi:hypothetical protein
MLLCVSAFDWRAEAAKAVRAAGGVQAGGAAAPALRAPLLGDGDGDGDGGRAMASPAPAADQAADHSSC